MESKQTSIDWLYQEITKKSVNDQSHNVLKIYEQAKEMHKQEVQNAFYKGIQEQSARLLINAEKTTPEQYYSETYNK